MRLFRFVAGERWHVGSFAGQASATNAVRCEVALPVSVARLRRKRYNRRVSENANGEPSADFDELLATLSPTAHATLTRAAGRSLAEVLPDIYDELRQLAGGYLRRERSDHTLQPTALVHEAYLRLLGQRTVDWQNRAHLLAIAAKMMRRILMNHAAARDTTKRGGKAPRLSLDLALDVFDRRDVSIAALQSALRELEALDPRQGQVVELRFFGGLTVEETAEVLGVSPATVKRDWTIAKMWLEREMAGAA
jgi:RNA polymerase sigma factor (TIGR02999 family)